MPAAAEVVQPSGVTAAISALELALSRAEHSMDPDAFLGTLLQEGARALDGLECQLFLFDQATGLMRADVGVDGTTMLPAPGLVDGSFLAEPFPADITPAWERLLTARKPVFFALETDREMFWPGALEFHTAHGHVGSLCVPLIVAGEPIGMLGFAMRGMPTFDEEHITYARFLSGHVAIALHLRALSRRALHVVRVEERERASHQQIAELTRANAAFQRSVDNLARHRSLKGLLDTVLLETTSLMGAVTEALFLYHPDDDTLRMAACVVEGEVVNLAMDERFAIWREPIPADHTDAWERICRNRELLWIDAETPGDSHWPVGAAWHQRMGHRIIGCIPLVVGDQVLGFLGPCFRSAEPLNEVRIAQCKAIAQHAALAIKLTELAKQAQDEAVAAASAEARATELSKSNQALREALQALAGSQQPEHVLEMVMRQAAAAFGSDCAECWMHDEGGDDVAYVRMMILGNDVFDRAALQRAHPTHPGANGFRVPPGMVLGEPLRRRTRYFIIEDWNTDEHVASLQLTWIPSRGYLKQINLPLNVGGETVGALVVRMRKDALFTDDRIELAQALADQVALALELERLAALARETGRVEERYRLAREIHDTLSQSLASILINARTVAAHGERLLPPAREALRVIELLAKDGLRESRRSFSALRPASLERSSLAQALQEISASNWYGVPVNVTVDEHADGVPENVEDELLRIAQEAVANAMRHGDPGVVHLWLRRLAGELVLEITDDGRGFDVSTTVPGIGLRGLQERADRIGAQLEIDSLRRRGTTVRVRLRLPE